MSCIALRTRALIRSSCLATLGVVTVLGCSDAPTAPARATELALPRRPVAATLVAPVMPTALPTPDGPSGMAVDINDSGVVVGYFDDAAHVSHFVRWPPGASPEPLPGLARVFGIAADGTVGGVPSASSCRAARWNPTRGMILSPLDQPAANACISALAMSDSGRYIVGSFPAPPTNFIYDLTRPFSWLMSANPAFPSGIVVDFGPTNSTWKYSLPRDVNDRSLLVGEVAYPPQRRQAAAWNANTGLVLFGPSCVGTSPTCNSAAYGVNNAGVIVGSADGRAVRFDGGIQELLPGGGPATAVDVNDAGEILIQEGYAAYLLRGPELVPLAALRGGCCVTVSKVNERSQVVGRAVDGVTGFYRPVIWDVRATPPPPPLDVSAGGAYAGVEGSPVSFAATATGGTAPLTYRWAFGDGATATTLDATHTYLDDGVFTVTFTATGADGQSASATSVANVANAPPMLALEPGATIRSGETFTVRGRVTDAGVDDAPWRWTVQWPAGLPVTEGTLQVVPGDFASSAVLRRAGSWAIPVDVVDDDGGRASGSVTVNVQRLVIPMDVAPSSANAAQHGDGLLTVTLYPDAGITAADIVPESVRLEGVPVATRGNGSLHATLESGTLVLKFRRDALRAAWDAGRPLVLQADARDGRQLESSAALLATQGRER